MERVMVDSGRASRSSSRISGSVESSSNSIASQDELEMRPLTHASASRPVPTNIPSRAFAELSNRTYPSHPSHPRRLSDPGCPTASTRLMVLIRGGHYQAIGNAPLVIACIPPIPSPPPTQVDAFSGTLFDSRLSNLGDAAGLTKFPLGNASSNTAPDSVLEDAVKSTQPVAGLFTFAVTASPSGVRHSQTRSKAAGFAELETAN